MKKNTSLIAGIIIIITITASLTFVITSSVMLNKFYGEETYNIKFNVDDVNKDNVLKFNQVKNLLKNLSLYEIDENVLLEGAVRGMAFSLNDPYTIYYDKEQMEYTTQRAEGSFVGIGVTINVNKDGILTIVEPYEDSPAFKAGLQRDDMIMAVDDKDVTGITDENIIINMIKGEEDTEVKITVYRPSDNKYIDFDLTRKRVKVVNVFSEAIEGNIGYLKIRSFDLDSSDYFMSNLKQLLDKNIRGLIIDLRDNTGGSYREVVKIVDRIIPEGIIVYTEDREGNKNYEMSDDVELGLPLAILINDMSASASEVLAGAVKDHSKGVLVGTTTFGKGLVQLVWPLDDGSGLRLTTSRYYTPSGVSIHGIGIEPHLKVELNDEYKNYPVSQIPREFDTQLKRAIQFINKLD